MEVDRVSVRRVSWDGARLDQITQNLISLRRDDKDRYVDHFVALRDFDLPRWGDANDPIRRALIRRGLRRPDHSTRIASAIASDSDYDQILCVPEPVSHIRQTGVFDYGGAMFSDLYQQRALADFQFYLRYRISDRRQI